jgi:pyridoxal phosphate enzyme (YggS family)
MAVGKTQPQEAIAMALAAGQRLFGENRVQEAKTKFEGLRTAEPGLRLHLIGPLQTNKAEDAVRLFDVIEVLDRPALADALARAMQKTGRAPQFYIEVNLGAEPQKAGIAPGDLAAFLAYARKAGLSVTGLMAIPPQEGDPEPYFRQLKKLADEHNLSHISMGMSADFEAAIRCGATEVRIGTALFGAREKPGA